MKKMKFVKFIISVMLIAVTAFLLSFNVFTVKTNVGYNGKGSCEVIVESDKSEVDFRKYVSNIVTEYNLISGDDDFWKVKSVEKTDADNEYRVEVEFRRVDKLKGPGDFYLQDLSSFTKEESLTLTLLKNLRDGNWKNTWITSLDGKQATVFVDKTKRNNQKFIVKDVDGEVQNTSDENGEDYFFKKDDPDAKIFLFRLVGLKNVKSLTLSLYGRIDYIACAEDSVKAIDENTIKITPVTTVATIDHQIDDNGNNLLTDMDFMFGYVVFTPYISPVTLAAIIICVALVVLCLVLIIAYFCKRGADSKGKSGGNGFDGNGKNAVITETKVEEADVANDMREVKMNVFQRFLAGVKVTTNGKTYKLLKKQWILYLLILPAVVLLFIFNYLPFVGIIISFQDYNVIEGIAGSEWIGLKTFKNIFIEPTSTYYLAIRNTIYISILRIAVTFPMILLFAILLNEIKSKKLRGAFQVISYIPYFISWVAVGSIANNLFMDEGIFNKIIASLGGESISWYTVEKPWWTILTLSSLWKGMGWGTLIYISAMSMIDEELYDACLIDGGGRFRQALAVTLPGIGNVVMLQLLMNVASLLGDNAEQIMALTNGNNDALSNLQVIGTGIIGSITGGGSYSASTAIGVFQGVVGLILVLVMDKIAKKTEHEGIL